MLNKKSAVAFDLDGTIFEEFLDRDKFFIDKIFKNNYIVFLIDRLARKVNSFDIIKNSMAFLKLRLAIYSLFSNKKYSEIINQYEKWYRSEVKEAIACNIGKLKNRRYKIIVLSNNLFSKNLSLKTGDFLLLTTKSKFKTLKKIKEEYNILFMVGNNMSDDILPANMLNIPTIYLGKNKFVKLFSKFSFQDFETILKFLR